MRITTGGCNTVAQAQSPRHLWWQPHRATAAAPRTQSHGGGSGAGPGRRRRAATGGFFFGASNCPLARPIGSGRREAPPLLLPIGGGGVSRGSATGSCTTVPRSSWAKWAMQALVALPSGSSPAQGLKMTLACTCFSLGRSGRKAVGVSGRSGGMLLQWRELSRQLSGAGRTLHPDSNSYTRTDQRLPALALLEY